MGESCFIVPTVQNSKGEHVPSKLFEDLWKLSNNYEWANAQYKIATDSEFLESAGEDAVFDSNGQIDARSFMDITGVTFTSDEIKEKLSKRWEEKALPTEEVSSTVTKFNTEEELKGDFVPVIKENEGRTVSFTVAQRTPDRVAALQTYLENNETLKVITNRLKQLGVAYDFIGSNKKYYGRFSTENAQKAFDGLYHLIEIAGGADVQDTLVEESAHLATLACKDSTFIDRLLNAINENTASSLFTPEELERGDLNTMEGKLELAGILVAKAMKNELEGNYKSFLNRVKQAIYKVFAKTNFQSLLSERQRAKLMAEVLSHGFLFDAENFSVETALTNPLTSESAITLFSTKRLPEHTNILKTTFNRLRQLGARIDNFSKAEYNNIYKNLTERAVLGDRDIASVSDEEIGTFTASAAKTLIDTLQTLLKKLSEVDPEIFNKEVNIDTVNTIFEAVEVFETLRNLGETYHSCVSGLSGLDAGLKSSLRGTFSTITSTLSDVEDTLFSYVNLYSLALMRETIGRDAIDVAADVFLNVSKRGKGLFSFIPKLSVERREARTGEDAINIGTFLTSYVDGFADTNRIVTFFRTYGNNKDITTQVFYDAIRRAKASEAINYNREGERLDELEDRWKKFIGNAENRRLIKSFGFDPDTIFYERTKEGKLTGHFIGEEKEGQFYEDQKAALKAVKDAFKNELENGGVMTSDGSMVFTMKSYRALSKAEKYAVFSDYRDNHPTWITFEALAYEDKEKNKKSSTYKNKDFIELCEASPEFKKLFDEITEFKRYIDDEYLTDLSSVKSGLKTHGVHSRVPQFKARFITRLIRKQEAARQKRRDLADPSDLREYCEDVTSDNFGSPITESVALSNKEEQNAPELDRLALYGINLLEDMSELSTDLFRSLDKYIEMACRYNSSQSVVTKLEVFNHQLERRAVIDASLSRKTAAKQQNAKIESSRQRHNMLDRFIYVDPNSSKKGFLGAVLGPLAAFGAIRALCISGIAGLKNWVAGYRVLLQDVSAGVYDGVTLKDVIKSTVLNLSPKHIGGEVARVLSGGTVNWDQYQKLVDRWDSYRTPAKIHRRKGFYPLQTLINIAMSNYSITDNSLIGIIYYSKLGSMTLYDANTFNSAGGPTKITAADAYNFSKEGTPRLKEGLLKDPAEFTTYRFLKGALDAINNIIKTNEEIKEYDLDDEPLRLDDPVGDPVRQLEDYFEYTLDKPLSIRNESGGYKSPEEILKVIKKEITDITYTDDDEFGVCSNINDYIISSQGVYGMLNLTQFQSNAYTQTLGKIKGYMFGILQRNFYSNYSISQNKFKHSMLGSYALALFSTFADAKELADEGGISVADYKRYMATVLVFPFALKNKTLRSHLQRCGWDPDQLSKIYSVCLGFIINWCLGILARCLYRGNEKKIGEKVISAKGRIKLRDSIILGLDPMVFGNLTHRRVKPGILFPDQAIQVDTKTAKMQKENWKKSGYRKNQKDASEGRFIAGTQEFYDRMEAYDLRNIIYDKDDPLYAMTGFFYRLTRGVRDEGLTLMNPTRFANDAIEMTNIANAIAISSGLTTILKGVLAAAVSTISGNDEKWVAWTEKECKFWLNKIGLTYDGNPEPGDSKVQKIDWYDKQEIIDAYTDRKNSIFQITR